MQLEKQTLIPSFTRGNDTKFPTCPAHLVQMVVLGSYLECLFPYSVHLSEQKQWAVFYLKQRTSYMKA